MNLSERRGEQQYATMETDPVVGTSTIRVQNETKAILTKLKIVQAESFDDVINRIIQTTLEDNLSLNNETRALLDKRTDKIDKAQVFSGNELLDRIRRRRLEKEGILEVKDGNR